jgi:tol-pal system protein YbgF
MTAHSNGRRILAAALLALLTAPIASGAAATTWRPPVPPADIPNVGVIQVQSSAQVAEQSMRIDRMEDQMRQLYGRIDELTFQIQQLQELLRRTQEDTEFRFQEMQGGGMPQKRSEAPSGLPSPGGVLPDDSLAGSMDRPSGAGIDSGSANVPVELGNGFSIDSGEEYGAPPRVLGTIPTGDGTGAIGSGPLDLSAIARGDDGYQTSGVVMPSGMPAEGIATGPITDITMPGALPPPPEIVDPVGQQVASVTTPSDPRAQYDEAYNHIVAGNYPMAESGFRQFLRDNASSPLAGDANFWLGESLYARGEYRDAADAFLTTYRDYPTSSKAPDSLLKLGLSLEGLGETDAACATYREVEKKFSSASGALLRQVESQKSKSGC